jgi:hypothetical protein
MTKQLQAIAGALRGDEKSRRLGHAHAIFGIPWCCPEGTDMLAYSLGHADGVSDRLCCSGERATPEQPR